MEPHKGSKINYFRRPDLTPLWPLAHIRTEGGGEGVVVVTVRGGTVELGFHARSVAGGLCGQWKVIKHRKPFRSSIPSPLDHRDTAAPAQKAGPLYQITENASQRRRYSVNSWVSFCLLGTNPLPHRGYAYIIQFVCIRHTPQGCMFTHLDVLELI